MRGRTWGLGGALLVLLLAAAPAGCLPSAPPSEAGSASFARQVVPLLYGRKPTNFDEVKVIADLVTATDRGVVATALMSRSELVDHWTDVLVDQFRAHRTGAKSQEACMGELPPPATPYSGTMLAGYVSNGGPTTAQPAGFDLTRAYNLNDVIRSSLAADNLYPAYRAFLWAMVAKPIQGAEVTPDNQRDDLAVALGQIFLNRDTACVRCHNSDWSVTGPEVLGRPTVEIPNSGEWALVDDANHDSVVDWNRAFPIPGSFEAALYGEATATAHSTAELNAILRTDVIGGSVSPWGISDCGTFNSTVPALTITPYFAGTQPSTASVFNLDALFASGHDALDANGLVRTPPPPEVCDACNGCPPVPVTPPPPDPRETRVENDLHSYCSNAGCHNATYAPAGIRYDVATWKDFLVRRPSLNQLTLASGDVVGIRVVPGDSSHSYLLHQVQRDAGVVAMPPSTPPAATKTELVDAITDWIDHLPASAGCSGCTAGSCDPMRGSVAGDAAFAFLVAENAVNQIWNEAQGYPLTIANHFSRTSGQGGVLQVLTEFNFVPSGWSLKKLLVQLLTSSYFNRHVPGLAPSEQPYVLPLAWDPWVERDLRGQMLTVADPANHRDQFNNAMGEAVHRHSANTLLTSLRAGLGWPPSVRFPASLGAYPSQEFESAMGQYLSDAQPGGRTVDFQGMLTWEAQVGTCTNPDATRPDWTSLLLSAAAARTGTTIEEVVLALKDRLVSDPNPLDATERTALEAFFGAPLGSPLSAVGSAAVLAAKVRGLCGSLLESPQFMLAGIAPESLGTRPALMVSLPGEPADYAAFCARLEPGFTAQGLTLHCNTNPATVDGYVRPGSGSGCNDNGEGCSGSGCSGCGAARPAPGPGAPLMKIAPAQRDAASALCPRKMCRYLVGGNLRRCFERPQACVRVPPPCDPRCIGGVNCCGEQSGPADWNDPRQMRGTFVAWADGHVVKQAEGVRVLHPGAREVGPLAAGSKLVAGDLIALPAGAQLRVDGPAGNLATPRGGMPAGDGKSPWLLLVTGESALRRQSPVKGRPGAPRRYLDALETLPGVSSGAAAPIPDSPLLTLKTKRRPPATPKK